MEKTYEIKHEPVMVNGETIDKYNVYYYDENGDEKIKEFHSYDGVSGQIRPGYVPKNNEY